MVQWEYNTLNAWRLDLDVIACSRDLQIALEVLGKEGWELVTVLHLQGGFQAFLKRPNFVRSEAIKVASRPPPTTVPDGPPLGNPRYRDYKK